MAATDIARFLANPVTSTAVGFATGAIKFSGDLKNGNIDGQSGGIGWRTTTQYPGVSMYLKSADGWRHSAGITHYPDKGWTVESGKFKLFSD